MKLKSNRIILSVIIIIGITAIGMGVWQNMSSDQQMFKVGAIISLSSPSGPSFIGEEVRDGMLLAVDEINAWGGINNMNVKLILKDSKSNPQQGASAFEEVEKAHRPHVYISTLSSVSLAIAPLAEKYQAPLFSLVATAQELTKKKNWVFRYWPTAQDESFSLATMASKMGIQHMGILHLDDEYGRSILKHVELEFQKEDRKVDCFPFKMSETDFTLHLKNKDYLDGILIIGFPNHVTKALQQIRENEFSGKLLNNNTVSLPAIRELPESEGVYVTTPIIYNPNFRFANEVSRKYENRFKKPFNHFAATGYDAMKLLAGLLDDNAISRQGIRDLLREGFNYPGVFGELHSKPGQYDISFPIHPGKIKNGKVVYLR